MALSFWHTAPHGHHLHWKSPALRDVLESVHHLHDRRIVGIVFSPKTHVYSQFARFSSASLLYDKYTRSSCGKSLRIACAAFTQERSKGQSRRSCFVFCKPPSFMAIHPCEWIGSLVFRCTNHLLGQRWRHSRWFFRYNMRSKGASDSKIFVDVPRR